MTPRGLLLDAMGTLIGLRRSVGASYAELAAAHGVQVEAAAVNAAFPRLFRQAGPLAFPGLAGQALLEASGSVQLDQLLAIAACLGHQEGLAPIMMWVKNLVDYIVWKYFITRSINPMF